MQGLWTPGERNWRVIDVVIPQQYNIVSKENERVNKYIDLASVMHSFRDSFPVCKLHSLLGYTKILSKTSRVGSGFQGKSSI